ncbi:MAG TPA: hypothetical protein VKT80_03535, partial [Chloroflexota bacterium]|nr:hypothetical protein [Chloroflexota bacterium]
HRGVQLDDAVALRRAGLVVAGEVRSTIAPPAIWATTMALSLGEAVSVSSVAFSPSVTSGATGAGVAGQAGATD